MPLFSTYTQIASRASRNAAMNPGVDVSQELGVTGATLANNTAKYTADCWEGFYNHTANTAVLTSAQLAAASFAAPLPGFPFGHRITATTAITAPATGDFARHRQKIEGYRISHWGWGAAGAAPIAVAFQLYSTVSGTAFVKLSNSDQSRCYYHEIAVAVGWNFYSFPVPGDVTGTWQATSNTGLTFEVFVSGKETTPASALDAWGAVNKVQTTNSTNLLGTNANATVLTGLFVDTGSLPAATDLPTLMRPFDRELHDCQRYWEKNYPYATAPGTAASGIDLVQCVVPSSTVANGQRYGSVPFKVRKRAQPTMTVYGFNGLVGAVSNSSSGADLAASSGATEFVGETQFSVFNNAGASLTTVNAAVIFNFAANARL